jgi:hypothetical protein
MCKRLDYADFRRRFGLRFAVVSSSLVGRCCTGVFSFYLKWQLKKECFFLVWLVRACDHAGDAGFPQQLNVAR